MGAKKVDRTPFPSWHFDHRQTETFSLDVGPLSGLRHKTIIDYRKGAQTLALWQEEHLSGFHVQAHHHDCEEIITVIKGEIKAAIRDEMVWVMSGQSIVIPAWKNHSFRVISSEPVRLLAIFASARPKIFRHDGTESIPPWEGGSPTHLHSS